MRIKYEAWTPTPAIMLLVDRADAILSSLVAQGYTVTVRQLYYQFVGHDFFPDEWRWSQVNGKWVRDLLLGTKNAEPNYQRLKDIVNRGRMAGLLDWRHVVDRTRELKQQPHWGDATDEPDAAALEFIETVIPQFRTERWSDQPRRVEVWIEKEALIDVAARPAKRLGVPWFASRGYNSQSNAHEAAERVEGYLDGGADEVTILHLGDHDPEGVDMTRDIEERFRLFLEVDGYDPDALQVRRIALTMPQVRQFDPPPNPAKPSSSRYNAYRLAHGDTCWELDALDPPVLDALITAHVEGELDQALFDAATAREDEARALLEAAASRWGEVVDFLRAGE